VVRGRGEIGRRRRLKIAFPWSAGSSPAVRTIIFATALLAGCNPRPDSGAVVVSAIGGVPSYADASRVPLNEATRLLADSTAQGLVRFDAAGQIEPGLAERWIVIDGGMTYIFRLREANWADGKPVTAEAVVSLLKRQVAPSSRNPLAPFLTAVDDIVVMTPQVIEVQLKRPRPDLLKLFAQPELALVRLRPPSGGGPFRVQQAGRAPLLRPVIDPNLGDPDDRRSPQPEEHVRLIGERAASAIARFGAHRSDLVTGGTFADWPLIALSDVAPANIRIDPAAGLFGFAIVSRDGFLADPANRAAIAGAIDRTLVTGTVLPAWQPVEQILPEQLDSAAPPHGPAWAAFPIADRQAQLRGRVDGWTGGSVTLRIALPPGPGATLVYAATAASLARAGIGSTRVAINAPAELRLVDAVAPYDSARWYLATACRLCGDAAQAALAAAREAPTPAERAARIADADAALADDTAFIPLARPLRWSLVALRLRQWQPNSRAWHPLNRLRPDTTS
jgi:oligopeptide transport system substrate-binding protein